MGIHVACVGDSITQGSGTSGGAATYPSVLGSLLGAGWDVENDGRSGTTLLESGDFPFTNTVQYTASTAWSESGGDVVIQLGTNDSKPANWSGNSASFLGDCKALVAHYRSAAIPPRVWISLPPPATSGACCKIDGTVIANEIVPLLETCAADTGASTIDVHSAFAGHLDWLTDGVHPNDEGAALIAQTVHDALVRVPSVTLDVDAPAGTVPVKVALSATPSAAYGRIEKIRFYDSASVVSEITSAPWSFALEASEGRHVYRAEAIETGGRTATSTSTAVVVEGAAVVVTPNAPPDPSADAAAPGSDASRGETSGVPLTAPANEVTADDDTDHGCSMATGGTGFDALATFVVVAFVLRRLTSERFA